MIVNRVSAKEYSDIIHDAGVVYNLAQFNELNKSKVDDVEYLIVSKGNSPRFAVCLGVADNSAYCPFSAPFALPIELKKTSSKPFASIKNCVDTINAIDKYCTQKSYNSLQYILPPIFYSEHIISAWINALYNSGYIIENIDINYSLELNSEFVKKYPYLIPHNARNTLKKSLNQNLELTRCSTINEVERAYAVISENKRAKGYPLRMSYNQVCDTINVVPHDVFLVQKDSEDIASAIVYHVTENIVQIIYWGDRPGFSDLRPMNYLAYQLIQHYSNNDIKYIDIGPSTENSIPNYGLCDFKESIGCKRSLQFTMKKML